MAKKKNKLAAAAAMEHAPAVKKPALLIFISAAWGIFILYAWLFSPQFSNASFSYFYHHFNAFFLSIGSGFFSVLPGYLLEASVFAILAASCHGSGRFALSFFKEDFSCLEKLSFSFGLGMMFLSSWVFALSVLHLLYPAAIWLFAAAGMVLGYFSLRRMPFIKPDFRSFWKNIGFLEKTAFFCLLCFAAFAFFSALSPEIFYDSLVYHLGIPNLWVNSHGFVNVPDNLYSNLFMFHGMIFSAGLSILYSEAVPKLFNCYSMAIAILSFTGISCRYFSARFSVWPALFFLSFVICGSSLLYAGTETMSAMYCSIALAAALRALFPIPVCSSSKHKVKGSKEKIDADTISSNISAGPSDIFEISSGSLFFYVMSGFFAGCAMAVKATALLYVISLMLMIVFFFRKNLRLALKPLILFSLPAALPVIPWLIKNIVYCGNPFFPFATSVFGIPEGYSSSQISAFMADTHPRNSFISWLKHPWSILRGAVTGGDIFPPLFFLILPFVPMFFSASPVIPLLAVFSAASWLLWSSVSEMPRFLLPVLPAISIIITAAEIAKPKVSAWLRALFLAQGVFMFMIFFSLIGNQDRYYVLFNKVSADYFLSNSHNIYPFPVYQAIKYVNENLPSEAKIIFLGDSRGFFLRRIFSAASAFNTESLARLAETSSDADEMYAKLKASGFTHVIFNPGEAIRNKVYRQFKNPHAREVFRNFYNKHLSLLHFSNELYRKNIVNTVFVMEISEKGSSDMIPNYLEERLKEEELREHSGLM